MAEHAGLPRQDRREPAEGDGGLTRRPPDTRRARRATRLTFLVVGIVMAGWAPLIPDAKLRLGLDEATLGLAMLGLGAGSIVATPLAGLATHYFGSRTVILSCGSVFCLSLPVLVLAPSLLALTLALMLFGASLAAVDVSMNAQAVVVERESGRPLMSGFHGRFSVGGLFGASAASLLLLAGATPLLAACLLAVAGGLILFSQARYLLPVTATTGSPFRWPRGRLVLIGALCFIGFLAEGAMLDWSAVFLRFSRNTDPAAAGLGYALFSVTMALGRLTGDRMQAALGGTTLLRWGALIAAAGFTLATAVPFALAGLLGFALVGIGLANIVPVLFGAAGRLPGMDPGPAISAVSSAGYLGLLAGPVLIGLAAQVTSLTLALAGVGLLLLILSAASTVAVTPAARLTKENADA